MIMLITVVHVLCMVISIVGMSSAVVLGVMKNVNSVFVAGGAMVATVLGSLSGAILLLDASWSPTCVALTLYLLAVTALYSYGFGFGRVSYARFIRQ